MDAEALEQSRLTTSLEEKKAVVHGWSREDVRQYLLTNSISHRSADTLYVEHLDGRALWSVKEHQLAPIIYLGDRVKILQIVEELHMDVAEAVRDAYKGSFATPYSADLKCLETNWQVMQQLIAFRKKEHESEELEAIEMKYERMKRLFLSHLWHADKVQRMLWDTDLGFDQMLSFNPEVIEHLTHYIKKDFYTYTEDGELIEHQTMWHPGDWDWMFLTQELALDTIKWRHGEHQARQQRYKEWSSDDEWH